jgi:hypothetical protein
MGKKKYENDHYIKRLWSTYGKNVCKDATIGWYYKERLEISYFI